MKLKIALLCILSCALFYNASAQQTKSNDIEYQPMDKAIYYGHLQNGLTYYVRKNVSPKNRAVLYLVEKAGSLQEDDEQRGLAHFVEHMAFRGTPHFPKNELISYLQKSGVTYGADVNAQTTFNQTCYQLLLPTDSAKVFEKGLDIMADWAGHLSFDPEEINSERNIILEEERLRLKTASGRMALKTLDLTYNNSRYNDRLPIGTVQSINSLKADAFKKFYNDWYRPDAEAVIVVGDFNPRQVVELIKNKFSDLQNPPDEKEVIEYPIPEISGTRVRVVTDPEAVATSVTMTVRLPGTKLRSDIEYYQRLRINLLNYMLNARINELVTKGNPPFLGARAYNVTSLGNTDVFVTHVTAKPGELERSVKSVFSIIENVKKFGVTADELKMAKEWWQKGRAASVNNMANHESAAYAEEYRRNFLTGEGIPGLEYEYDFAKNNIDKIQSSDLEMLMQMFDITENRTIVVEAPEKEISNLPDEKTLLSWIDASNGGETAYKSVQVDNDVDILPDDLKSGRIEAGPLSDPSGADTFVLSNGARVILKNTNFSAGQVLFDVYSFGGTSIASDAEFPSASLAGALVRQSGVSNFDQLTLDKILANKMAIEPYINLYGQGIRGGSSQRYFETALKLIHLYFTAPRSDSTVWAGLLSTQRAFLQTRANSPGGIFADSIHQVMINHNPRASYLSEEMLKKASMSKAYDFYKQRFADAANFTFVFVGNLDDIGIRALIKKYIGSLPATRRNETFTDLHLDPPPGNLTKVIRKGVDDKSAVELIFHGVLEPTSENHLQIKALGDILQIKLTDRLRQQESGVYSPKVTASWNTFPSPHYILSISFTCAAANTNRLVAATMDEINKIKQSGALPEDIQKFKADETRNTQINLKKNSFWVEFLATSHRNQEDAGQIVNYINNLNNVTPESTKSAANKYLNSDNLIQMVEMPEERK